MTAYQLLLNGGERVVPPGTASLLIATAPVFAGLPVCLTTRLLICPQYEKCQILGRIFE